MCDRPFPHMPHRAPGIPGTRCHGENPHPMSKALVIRITPKNQPTRRAA